ncbi:ABC transporter integral membrane type 1 [Penicillium chermesinum]|nr:ABC transporter integral membrane type 1 [Penicillium chermesinum]
MSDTRGEARDRDSMHGTKPTIRTSWKSLATFTASQHVPVLALGTLFALLAGCVTPVLAVLLGNMFDAFTSFGAGHSNANSLRSTMITNCLGMVGLAGAGLVLNGAYFMVFVAFGEIQASVIRDKVFEELLKRDVEWFEAHKEGMGAFLSGIQSLPAAGANLTIFMPDRRISRAGILYLLAIICARMKGSITAQQVELTEASKVVNNAITSIDTVKCLNAEENEMESYSSRIERSAFYYLQQARLNSVQIAMIRWMMFGMFVQGFWNVVRTFWACTTAAQSIEQILPQVIVMEKGKIASAILSSIVRDRGRHRLQSELRGTQYPLYCKGLIEVKNVSFAYPTQPERNVLTPSNFVFPAGETRFVIGKSGSGKSTLGALLLRFYLPKTGQIMVDGYPLYSLDVSWIRNNITLLEQKSVLFNDSVYRNMTLGLKNFPVVNAKDINEAIELAMLESTILNLPKGLNTLVGPGGSFLSGGQRQRVAIARAKLRDTPILILDEPTSALDNMNRVAVMEAIREWRKGKTTIIITHDMSHIRPDDFVYIMENGSIVHEGYRYEVERLPGNEKYFPSMKATQSFVHRVICQEPSESQEQEIQNSAAQASPPISEDLLFATSFTSWVPVEHLRHSEAKTQGLLRISQSC